MTQKTSDRIGLVISLVSLTMALVNLFMIIRDIHRVNIILEYLHR